MKIFADLHHVSLNKAGEELCGDQIRILRGEDRTRFVLSDGMGSGVKANILASLTVEIIVNMLRENASLVDVVETISGALPVDRELGVAYSTFTILEIEHSSQSFHVFNFDNPPVLFYRDGILFQLDTRIEEVLGRKMQVSNGTIEPGDFIVLMSDGVPYAGPGLICNLAWGVPEIARYIEDLFQYNPTGAKSLINKTIAQTRELYAGQPGDDATMMGIFFRPSREAILFTGPPLDEKNDFFLVDRVIEFPGTRIVCGGTTGNIVETYTGNPIQTDPSTRREDVPPISMMEGIDLLTEGILTLNKAAEWLDLSNGDISTLPLDRNGALLLARTLLEIDEITFLVGQRANPFYQNPLLPTSISIRKNLVERIADLLRKMHKQVSIEYF